MARRSLDKKEKAVLDRFWKKAEQIEPRLREALTWRVVRHSVKKVPKGVAYLILRKRDDKVKLSVKINFDDWEATLGAREREALLKGVAAANGVIWKEEGGRNAKVHVDIDGATKKLEGCLEETVGKEAPITIFAYAIRRGSDKEITQDDAMRMLTNPLLRIRDMYIVRGMHMERKPEGTLYCGATFYSYVRMRSVKTLERKAGVKAEERRHRKHHRKAEEKKERKHHKKTKKEKRIEALLE